MRHVSRMIILLAILSALAGACRAGEAVLLIRNAPPDGLVLLDVDLAPLLGPAQPDAAGSLAVKARLGDKPLPIQAWTDEAGRTGRPGGLPGMILLKLPAGGDHRVSVRSEAARRSPRVAASSPASQTLAGPLRASTPHLAVTHDAARFAGLPSRIEILRSGKVVTDKNFRWDDRLHSRELGGRRLVAAQRPRIVSDGPLATIVRVRGQYVDAKPGAAPEATAVYDWFYFRDRPLVLVRGRMDKLNDRDWDEHHFLELTFSDKSFPRWAGGLPLQQGTFSGSNKGTTLPQWGAMIDGRSTIALLRGGRPLIYDGLGGHGCYLLAHGEKAWSGWKAEHGRSRTFSAWYWIGESDDPLAAVRQASAGPLPSDAQASLLDSPTAQLLAEAEQSAADDSSPGGLEKRWRVSVLHRLQTSEHRLDGTQLKEFLVSGTASNLVRFDLRAAGGPAPQGVLLFHIRSLADAGQGLHAVSLHDLTRQVELLSENQPPLFALSLRNTKTGKTVRLDSAGGWSKIKPVNGLFGRAIDLGASTKVDCPNVGASLLINEHDEGISFRLDVDNPAGRAASGPIKLADLDTDWSIDEVVFPQVAIRKISEDTASLFPRGPGEVRRGAWKDDFQFQGRYPNGWTTMQFLACYDQRAGTGLYVGLHDEKAFVKDIRLQGRSGTQDIVLSYSLPKPCEERRGYQTPAVVWRLFRGDWYDAACIYRDWVKSEAVWRGEPGRAGTPAWMRELPAWVCTGGPSANVVERVKGFQKWLGVPVGLHWYSWHRIPFDNDYPHYLPPREGFAQAVRELQRHNVRVMPYINGRLWDTRDKGLEDAEFTRTALPASTKDQKGKPFVETYGSKESDGSAVRLAVMCPHTKLWQEKVKSVVLSLMTEHGVDGVYIDQVAAAAPVLCMDASHGHPRGGGYWWQEGYAKMLDEIRRAMPAGKMLTTECNADPFVRWFDGYLTWHWQHDGQVPAFPAVYGGTIQMFGRAFRGGDSQDLAMRMKVGQQLCFGEQIGWGDVEQIRRQPSAEFFRDVVRLRWTLREFFYRGHMGRPPRLTSAPPTVTADWAWHGHWPVTTQAVQTGAWVIPSPQREKANSQPASAEAATTCPAGRVVLLFANVSDAAYSGTLKLDLREYGLAGERFPVRVIRPAAPEGASSKPSTAQSAAPADGFDAPALLERAMSLPAKAAVAWEITSSPGHTP